MSTSFLLPVYCLLTTLLFAPPVASAQSDNTFTLVMESESLRNGKPDKDGTTRMTVTCTDAKSGMTVLVDGSELRTIFDLENRTLTTITTDKKGVQQAIKLPMLRIGNKAIDLSDYTYTATDETKQILGYTARKFLFTGPDATGESWIADIPGIDWSRFADAVLGGRKGSSMVYIPHLDGGKNPIQLEGHSVTNRGKTTTHTHVTSVKLDGAADLSLLEVPSGVELTDMTGLLRG